MSPKTVKARPTMTVDDFVPDGGEVESFLDDSEESDDEDSEEDRCVKYNKSVYDYILVCGFWKLSVCE